MTKLANSSRSAIPSNTSCPPSSAILVNRCQLVLTTLHHYLLGLIDHQLTNNSTSLPTIIKYYYILFLKNEHKMNITNNQHTCQLPIPLLQPVSMNIHYTNSSPHQQPLIPWEAQLTTASALRAPHAQQPERARIPREPPGRGP